jgi:hypothetical protein
VCTSPVGVACRAGRLRAAPRYNLLSKSGQERAVELSSVRGSPTTAGSPAGDASRHEAFLTLGLTLMQAARVCGPSC